jgi:chemotaxis protein CheC
MSTPSSFQELQQNVWKTIVKKGCQEASDILKDFFKTPLHMTGMVMGFVPISKMFFLAGNPEEIVKGARMVFSGDIHGHMLLILTAKSWEVCRRILLEQIPQAEKASQNQEELELSAFSEMANIACSYFMVNLANTTGFNIHFTPPEVMDDMTATVLEETLVELSEDEESLLTVETTFAGEKEEMKGYLFFIPSPNSVRRITEKFLEVMPGPKKNDSG